MPWSFLEGAKATIRRAGVVDISPSTNNSNDSTLEQETASHAPLADSCIIANAEGSAFGHDHGDSHGAHGGGHHDSTAENPGSAAPSSLPWSLSLLRASGASSVTKAMLPLKKALGGDPDAIEARATLTKYKAELSAALSQAASAAAERRDERDLLTRALAGHENDLRCWGYLSVLPAFRQHRRDETNRAQLRTTLAEQEAQVISAKLQEVNRLLRSMPIIGPWTKPPGTVPGNGSRSRGGRSAPEVVVDGDGDGDGGAGGGSSASGLEEDRAAGDGGFAFGAEAFVVPATYLLTENAELASMRLELVLCDRACAVAADAFAMKVVDAGGLEPRSPKDRAEALLSLLTRYHVLGYTMAEAEAATAARAAKSRRESMAAVSAGAAAATAAAVVPSGSCASSEDASNSVPDLVGVGGVGAVAHDDGDGGCFAGDGIGNGIGTDTAGVSVPGDKVCDRRSDPGAVGEGASLETIEASSGSGGGGSGDCGNYYDSDAGGGGGGTSGTSDCLDEESPAAGAPTAPAAADSTETLPLLPPSSADGTCREGDPARTGKGAGGVGSCNSGDDIHVSSPEVPTVNLAATVEGSSSSSVSTEEPPRTAAATAAGSDEADACAEPPPPSAAATTSKTSDPPHPPPAPAFPKPSSLSSLSPSPPSSSLLSPPTPPFPSQPRSSPSPAAVEQHAALPTKGEHGIGGGGVGDSSSGGGGSGSGRGAEGGSWGETSGEEGAGPECVVVDVRSAREGRKECEEAFLELMSDERTREGRLLRRFLTMAQAKRSPPSSSSTSSSASLAKPVGSARSVAAAASSAFSSFRLKGSRAAANTGSSHGSPEASVGVSDPGGAGEDWEEEGKVGPQVVMAFINYFSKENLGDRFDVPDLLLPSLTELVASLVFRQARRLVLGYDRRRVKSSDLAWRGKAEQMRSIPLLHLGVPPEYIPGGSGGGGRGDAPANVTLTAGATSQAVPEDAADGPLGGRAEGGERPRDEEDRGFPSEEAEKEGGGRGEWEEEPTVERSELAAEEFFDPFVVRPDPNSVASGKVGAAAAASASAENDGVDDDIVAAFYRRELARGRSGSDDDALSGAAFGACGRGAGGAMVDLSASGATAVVAMAVTAPEMLARSSEGGGRSAPDESELPAVSTAAAVAAEAGRSIPTGVLLCASLPSPPRASSMSSPSVAVDAAPAAALVKAATTIVGGAEAVGVASTARSSGQVKPALSVSSVPSTADLSSSDERAPSEEIAGPDTAAGAVATGPGGAGRGETEPHYARASEEFGRLGDCVTPDEMLAVVKDGMKCLAEDAAGISKSNKPLDADTLLPLLVYALVHASLPRVHEALNFIRNFRGPSWGGEQAYYVTSIEAAVSFVLDWSPGQNSSSSSSSSHYDGNDADHDRSAVTDGVSPSSSGPQHDESKEGSSSPRRRPCAAFKCRRDRPAPPNGPNGPAAAGATGGSTSPSLRGVSRPGGGGGMDCRGDAEDARARDRRWAEQDREEGMKALMRLGIFLETHEVQEDTVDVLASAGWL